MKKLKVDRLVAALPQAIASGEDVLVSWMGDFARLSDRGAVYDSRAIASQLAAAGYAPGPREAHAGDCVTIEKHGAEAYRRRLLTFAYHFLDRGLPIPDAAVVYADYYFKKTGVERVRSW